MTFQRPKRNAAPPARYRDESNAEAADAQSQPQQEFERATEIITRLSQDPQARTDAVIINNFYTADPERVRKVLKNPHLYRYGNKTIRYWLNEYKQLHSQNFPPIPRRFAQPAPAAPRAGPGPADEPPPLPYLFRSKGNAFEKHHGFKPTVPYNSAPDIKLKTVKQLQKPYFSPVFGSWEIDIVFAMDPRHANRILQHYLFCININTKYLEVFPIADKSSEHLILGLNILIQRQTVKSIRADGESGLMSAACLRFFAENDIKTFFSNSPFTNHNRIVDRVIRTIRDAFSNHLIMFARPELMDQVVFQYNNTPHSSFNNRFTPRQVNNNLELEGIYIRRMEKRLKTVLEKHTEKHVNNYVPGNILMISLDFSRTDLKFIKKRSNFNDLAEFLRYKGGSVLVRLLRPYGNIEQIEVPVYKTHKLADSFETLSPGMRFKFAI